jgi:DNA repair protein RecN (Recombination protein N)
VLRELHISNLAVITDARVELAGGLNCFTGATGAGKSLIIGAIGVLLGLRPAGQMLRRGVEEGRVAGVFELRDRAVRRQIEAACDLSLEGDELLLTRRLYASGRTSASVNGQPITVPMLKSVGELLVDIHGQHDHQFLLKPANQLDVLDQYAGTLPLREKYHDVYQQLQQAKQKLADLTRGEKERRQRLDFLKFQADEIDAAEPEPEEFAELEQRGAVLDNIEELKTTSSEAYGALYEDEGAVVDRLRAIGKQVAELAAVDSAVKPIADSVAEAAATLEEAARDLGRYSEKLDLNPAELEMVNERLNTLNRLLKKYGPTMPDLMEHRATLRAEIEQLDRAGEDAGELEASLQPLARKQAELAAELSTARTAAGKKLAPLIAKQLAELGMGKATFSVSVTPGQPPVPSGTDIVEFIAQTNPGLPEQPLRKIASGGELSRIMLALKQVLARGDRISVLVFDEIDANVGGRLGTVIGGKLRQLAEHHQVLCITHLPQIAAHADRHLTVTKAQGRDDTVSTVETMTGDHRLRELAEMIGGERITDTTLAQAQELMESATVKRPAKRSRKKSA